MLAWLSKASRRPFERALVVRVHPDQEASARHLRRNEAPDKAFADGTIAMSS